MKKTIQELKSYFETGNKPKEVQYIDLLDSLAMPMVGEIKTVSFATIPSGWAACNGQLLNIAEHSVLFNLIGTTYGGDGTSTFALPNLQGKTMIHNDSTYTLGQAGGTTENTLTESQLPAHNHDVGSLAASHNLTGTVKVNEEDGESGDPQNKNFGVFTGSIPDYIYNPYVNDKLMAADNVQIDGNVTLSGATANTGSATPINNMQPYLVVNTIIALEGIDPLAS
ncbi:microcystin-dependent protein [Kordia periserrulae]|uniref:Microcystin-dependent protein n=1 Tax=Kordia periserrulae TaxID=701523 RepID=A0A2T6BX33_9FLAO|nr:tail fiber protein [Kordia periserrulae]PTX60517.1 microcystin-dependent protein [Kordia periserrulae]